MRETIFKFQKKKIIKVTHFKMWIFKPSIELSTPSAHYLHNNYFVFQQDNAPCHKSRATIAWFEENGIPLLQWPSRSPDLNPIENIWRIMGMRLRAYKPNNLQELRELLSTIWNGIPVQQCRNLVNSMPRRVRLCLRAGGGSIDYWGSRQHYYCHYKAYMYTFWSLK